jgi:hypothetical protein
MILLIGFIFYIVIFWVKLLNLPYWGGLFMKIIFWESWLQDSCWVGKEEEDG